MFTSSRKVKELKKQVEELSKRVTKLEIDSVIDAESNKPKFVPFWGPIYSRDVSLKEAVLAIINRMRLNLRVEETAPKEVVYLERPKKIKVVTGSILKDCSITSEKLAKEKKK